jgi:NAD(P)-dependent dehydrogenase (short-subunit alcohol dehydrogenase family)
MSLLQSKTAIVTGAAQGIGYAASLIYAENGANVVLCDILREDIHRAATEIQEKTGVRCEYEVMDCTKASDIAAAVEKAVSGFGKLDILGHCAGILLHAHILDMKEEEWDRIFAVNAKGTFLVNQMAARQMVRQGQGGKIINFSSCSGKKPTEQEAAYCATKSAVNGFTKVAALEWGVHNINVNAICPGATDTPMVRNTFITGPEVEREWIEKTALKRLGRPLDQARVALFLASELSDHVTGETIVVSAGEMMTQ